MLEDKFNVIYLALLIVISIIRKIYTRKFGGEKIRYIQENLVVKKLSRAEEM